MQRVQEAMPFHLAMIIVAGVFAVLGVLSLFADQSADLLVNLVQPSATL